MYDCDSVQQNEWYQELVKATETPLMLFVLSTTFCVVSVDQYGQRLDNVPTHAQLPQAVLPDFNKMCHHRMFTILCNDQM